MSDDYEKRAPVQGERARPGRAAIPEGTISWEEHLEAYGTYARKFGSGQSAERIAQRAGFSYGELIMFLGHEPKTWRPR